MKNSPLFIVVLTVFIALIGFGIVIPLLPIYASQYGANGLQVGTVLMTYSLMQFILAPLAGKLSDKIGRRPVILVALLITALSYVLLAMAKNLPQIYISRILAGIGGADITVAQAYIADITTRENRAKGMGLFGAAFSFGFMVGPALGGILAPHGNHVPPLVAASFVFVTLIFALFLLPEPQKHESRAKRNLTKVKSVSKTVLILIILNFFIITLQGQLHSMFVLFTNAKFHWSPSENGYFLGVMGIFAIAVQGGLIGSLSKRFGQKKLVSTGLFLIGVGMLLIGIGSNLYVLVGGGIINAIGFSLALPSLSSLTSLAASPGMHGQALGLYQSAGSLGRILAPIIGGFLFDMISPSAPLVTGAGMAMIVLIISQFAMRKVVVDN